MKGFLFTSDWHLRSTSPRARKDDFQESMWGKVDQILGYAYKHELQVVIAGDLFEIAKPAYSLLNEFLAKKEGFKLLGTAGQHDLPNHLWDNLHQSGLGALYSSGHIDGMIGDCQYESLQTMLTFFPWGSELGACPHDTDEVYSVAVCHQLTYQGKTTKMLGASKAKTLLKRMSGYDLVVIGDNHKAFIEEHDGRFLISPGSLMRSSADQMEHMPGFWEWVPGEEPERVCLDVLPAEDVLSREHIDKENDRQDRLDSFVQGVNTEYEVDLCFEKNMDSHLKQNPVSKQAHSIIMGCLEQ